MTKRFALIAALACAAAVLLTLCSCSRTTKRVDEITHFKLDSMDGILDRSGVEVDSTVSSDGAASMKITATEPRTVRLFELGDIDLENAKLVYRAMLRTKKLAGKAYLEMSAGLKNGEELSSRGEDRPAAGTTEWVTYEIMFLLGKKENPVNVKLNLVIEGKGTVWIDDILILKGPPII